MIVKRVLPLIIFLSISFSLQAQHTLASIKEAYSKRLDNTPKEYSYIHTDRDVYIAGDEVLFKIYLQTYPFIDTAAISKVCYIFLCDKKGTVLQRQVLKVKDKSAFGVMSLNKMLLKGEYFLIASTMWMQNFLNKTSHFKKINIFTSSSESKNVVVTKKQDIEVGFFPESGNLVTGMDQKIGVRSLNEKGQSINITVNIKNSKGVTLQTFNTGVLGLATFNLTPEENETYVAECTGDKGQTKTLNLPISNLTTPSLTINNQKKLFVQLNIPKNNSLENFFIVGSNSGNVVFIEEVKSTTLEKLLAINKSSMPAGMMVLHLINSKAQIIAERFVWISKEDAILKPKLSFSKSIGQRKRELGEVSIDFLKNIDANISVSISRKSWSDSNQLNIFEQTQILAALGNTIDYSNSSLQQIINDKNIFDDFLVVNGWRKFSPINLLADEPLSYTNENGIYIAGKITKAQTKTVIPNSKVDLIVLNADSTKYIYSEPTNQNGEFIFKEVAISKNPIIFYAATNRSKENALVDVNFYKHFTDTLKTFTIPPSMGIFQPLEMLYLDSVESKKFKNLQEVKIVSKRTTEIQKFDQEYVSALFENADQSIILKNEPNTSTIWQILQRNISGITIANTDTGKIVYFNRYFGVDAFSENGLGTVQFFLNEQPVSQFEIEGIAPVDIAYIKVFKGGSGYVLGAPRGGIALYTIKGKSTSDWRDKGFSKFDLQGYEPEYKIYNMQYSDININNTDLDYRPTIFWMPIKILKQQQKINFSYFSDDKENTEWVLKLNGITGDNLPIFIEQKIP